MDLSKSAAAPPCLVSLTRARGAPPRSSRSRAMGSRREAGRDRDWQGVARASRMSCQPYARARRAATVEPQPSYGVLARGRPRSRLAGGALALTGCLVSLTRARGAPPRIEPQPSYGVSARGRPRSRLAGGAWSRSRQARLGRVLSLDLSKSAAAPPCLVSLTRARGAPPRIEPQPSYGVSARGRPRSRLAGGAWSRSRQARLGRVLSLDLSKSAAAPPCLVSLTRARGAPPRSSRSRAMGSRREAGRDRDWQGGLGLAHARCGSVEF